jgi:hypothetical protein
LIDFGAFAFNRQQSSDGAMIATLGRAVLFD